MMDLLALVTLISTGWLLAYYVSHGVESFFFNIQASIVGTSIILHSLAWWWLIQ